VTAKNLRASSRRWTGATGLGEHLEEETTVAIDGAIHEIAYFPPIREGFEGFLIPELEGG
jgi:molybdopterin synthase sulfur carrier subunit